MSLVSLSIFLISLGVVALMVIAINQRFNKVNRLIDARLDSLATQSKKFGSTANLVKVVSDRERITNWLKKNAWINHLDHQLLMSGKDYKLDEFLAVSAGTFFVVFLLGLAVGLPFVIVTLVSFLGGFIPYIGLNFLIRKRQTLLEAQLPDVLDFIARSLQAGHSFTISMHMAATESPEPIASEFLVASNQINFGESIQDALNSLCQRIECSDMRFFTVAVIINREVGGDLALLLRNVSELIRNRLAIRMSVKAMTGEARATALILALIPMVMAVLLTALQPQMMSVMITDPIGIKLLVGSFVFMLLGVLWMRNLIRIRI